MHQGLKIINIFQVLNIRAALAREKGIKGKLIHLLLPLEQIGIQLEEVSLVTNSQSQNLTINSATSVSTLDEGKQH